MIFSYYSRGKHDAGRWRVYVGQFCDIFHCGWVCVVSALTCQILQIKNHVFYCVFRWTLLLNTMFCFRDNESDQFKVCCVLLIHVCSIWRQCSDLAICTILGQETTANQLAFCIMELARHPDILEKWELIIQCKSSFIMLLLSFSSCVFFISQSAEGGGWSHWDETGHQLWRSRTTELPLTGTYLEALRVMV